jgi:hypothetical protein
VLLERSAIDDEYAGQEQCLAVSRALVELASKGDEGLSLRLVSA